MARKAGSAKRDVAEGRTPSATVHADESEMKRLVQAHAKDLIQLTKEKDTANANLRNGWKLAKDQGISIKQLKQVIKEKKLTDDERLVEEKQLALYREALGVKPVVQLVLDLGGASPADDEAALKKAHDDGGFAHLEGKGPNDNPHALNTPRGQAWQKGLLDAQAATVKKMKPKDKDDGQGAGAVAH